MLIQYYWLTELRNSAVSPSKEDGELKKDRWSKGCTSLHSTSKAHLPVKSVFWDSLIYSLIISSRFLSSVAFFRRLFADSASLAVNTWYLTVPTEINCTNRMITCGK